MTTNDQTAMHIANCQICTLATSLRDCDTCKFNIGLEVKATDAAWFTEMLAREADFLDLKRTEADARF